MTEHDDLETANSDSERRSRSSTEPSQRRRPDRVQATAIAIALYLAAGLYTILSPYARTLSGRIWLTVGLLAAGLIVTSAVLRLAIVAERIGAKRIRMSARATAALIAGILAVAACAAYFIWSSRSATASTAMSGTITSPPDGASNVCQNKPLSAVGTADNLKNGYRLWLFLYVASANGGAGLYYPGDREPALGANGLWSGGAVFIGGTGQSGQRFTLWLVALGPKAYRDLGVNNPGPSPGFGTLKFAADVVRLRSVPFTTTNCA